ncbi:MAG: ROK family protein [Treponema sp.]|nr:ROK family protein [Treponema sp.]
MNHTSPKQIGDYNRNQMLSILRERGPTSRVELSGLLGISQTAVTRNTSKLLSKGIIRECGAKLSPMGRKPVLMELCSDFCYVLGADIVGGTLKVALADLLGNIVKYYEEPVRLTKGAHAVLIQLLAALRNVVAESGVSTEKIWVATIGTSGIFDPETGKSKFAFFTEGWEEIDIRKEVFNFISVETLIENDVNLDVIGESWKGVGRHYENILYVKLGQGLAARFVINGKLVRGEHKIAGEIGYMMPGLPSEDAINYENMLCNDAASTRYTKLGGSGKANTISDIFSLADSGDEAASALASQLLDEFAVVLLNSAVVLDPQVIILGGDASCFGEKEIALLKQKIERHLPLTRHIVSSMLDKKACLYGAVKMGLDRVEGLITDIW